MWIKQWNFHVKYIARGLALKERRTATRKWPIHCHLFSCLLLYVCLFVCLLLFYPFFVHRRSFFFMSLSEGLTLEGTIKLCTIERKPLPTFLSDKHNPDRYIAQSKIKCYHNWRIKRKHFIRMTECFRPRCTLEQMFPGSWRIPHRLGPGFTHKTWIRNQHFPVSWCVTENFRIRNLNFYFPFFPFLLCRHILN